MRASRSFLRNAAFTALLAVLLNALWPFLALAKPADPLLVPVCTTGGEVHYIEIDGGGSPSRDAQHRHCQLCVFGAERPAVPSARLPASAVPALAAVRIDLRAVPPPEFPSAWLARPRAPPTGF